MFNPFKWTEEKVLGALGVNARQRLNRILYLLLAASMSYNAYITKSVVNYRKLDRNQQQIVDILKAQNVTIAEANEDSKNIKDAIENIQQANVALGKNDLSLCLNLVINANGAIDKIKKNASVKSDLSSQLKDVRTILNKKLKESKKTK